MLLGNKSGFSFLMLFTLLLALQSHAQGSVLVHELKGKSVKIVLVRDEGCSGARCLSYISKSHVISADDKSLYIQRDRMLSFQLPTGHASPNLEQIELDRAYCELELKPPFVQPKEGVIPVTVQIPNELTFKVNDVASGQSDLDDTIDTVYISVDHSFVAGVFCTFKSSPEKMAKERTLADLQGVFHIVSVK